CARSRYGHAVAWFAYW
nr:immunoglobulin heavy chain junction region [Mus musculus]